MAGGCHKIYFAWVNNSINTACQYDSYTIFYHIFQDTNGFQYWYLVFLIM